MVTKEKHAAPGRCAQEGRKAKTPRPLMLAYDYREMVNELRDVAAAFHDHQSLRKRLERVVGKHIVPTSQAHLDELTLLPSHLPGEHHV